ncbi:BZ3500_MvSof-1268-A1-R1_Chr8-2g10152 [Microbotryum saponariae]|uniref:BZ3500_MvSof-1268-A1-R1_Chr8-2g10152 protein n=1 Tax=Microbotryum saponariae TaxID=289078 RepID=A0A2X0MUW1_9BASI|nr:BZ3500_MvSof-1268-A1-R1_Chr8-2g10152 [Microbotryum saponariae]SDA01888.1 BZ3501_MvSof-1269-A2-R1_Chr8-2g09903 [Microbotryum saponariae]
MAPRRRVSEGKKAVSPSPPLVPEVEDQEDDRMQVDEAAAGDDGSDENDDDEDQDDDDSDSSDGEAVVPLLAGRERRANAGNRMAALLEDEAQAEMEEMFKEEENDIEFEAKFEEDVFDSDFGSTDSDADQEDDEEAGERQLQREAEAAAKGSNNKRKAKKAYTSFAPAFARQTKYQQKASAVASTSASTLDGNGTSTPGGGALTPELSNRNKRRRGWPDGIDRAFLIPQRESSRRSAVAFKESVEERLKESEERRATLPKPSKKTQQNFTQADLIAEALETEEINRASLLAFYAAEEDRRAAERVIGQRYEIIGPKLIELSRREGGLEAPDSPGKRKGKGRAIDGGATTVRSGESGRRRLIEVLGEAGKAGWKPGEAEGLKAAQEAAEKEGTTMDKTRQILSPDKGVKSADMRGTDKDTPSVPDDKVEPQPSAETKMEALDPPIVPIVTEANGVVPIMPAAPDAGPMITPAPDPAVATPYYARNYLIFDEFVGATVGDEMEALFGDHCDWDTAKSVTLESNRRPKICPITGLSAKYRDPRTMTPYANKYAYDVLTQLLSSTKTAERAGDTKPVFSWNETLGAYSGVIGLGKLHVDVGTNAGALAPIVGTIEKDPLTLHEQSSVRATQTFGSAGPAKIPRTSTGYMGVGGRNAKKREDNE